MKDLRSKNKTKLIMSTIQLAKSGLVLQNSSLKTPLFFFFHGNYFFWQRIHIQLLIVSSIFHSSSFLSNTDDVHVWWLSIVKTTEKLVTIYGTPIYQQARHGCPDKVWQLNKMLSILCPNHQSSYSNSKLNLHKKINWAVEKKNYTFLGI